MDQITVKDFAARIRSKYPGEYDDLPDSEIASRVTAKYPEYRGWVREEAPAEAPGAEAPGIHLPSVATPGGYVTGITRSEGFPIEPAAGSSIGEAVRTGAAAIGGGIEKAGEIVTEGLRRFGKATGLADNETLKRNLRFTVTGRGESEPGIIAEEQGPFDQFIAPRMAKAFDVARRAALGMTQFGRSFGRGFTLGNVDPVHVASAILGNPDAAKVFDTEIAKEGNLGDSAAVFEKVGETAGTIAGISKLYKPAAALAPKITRIPFWQSAVRGTIAGTEYGVLKKPEKGPELASRIAQVPESVLWFAGAEIAFLTAGQAMRTAWQRARSKFISSQDMKQVVSWLSGAEIPKPEGVLRGREEEITSFILQNPKLRGHLSRNGLDPQLIFGRRARMGDMFRRPPSWTGPEALGGAAKGALPAGEPAATEPVSPAAAPAVAPAAAKPGASQGAKTGVPGAVAPVQGVVPDRQAAAAAQREPWEMTAKDVADLKRSDDEAWDKSHEQPFNFAKARDKLLRNAVQAPEEKFVSAAMLFDDRKSFAAGNFIPTLKEYLGVTTKEAKAIISDIATARKGTVTFHGTVQGGSEVGATTPGITQTVNYLKAEDAWRKLHQEAIKRSKPAPAQPKHRYPGYKPNEFTPVLNTISDNGGLIAKSKVWNKGKGGGEYDGAPSIGELGGFSRAVFGGQIFPDKMAQMLYDEGLIEEPSADAMWNAIRSEIQSYRTQRQLKIEEEINLKEHKKWEKVSETVPVDKLKLGDEFKIKGEDFSVKKEGENALLVKDGEEFWIPYESEGGNNQIRVDKGSFRPSEGKIEAAPGDWDKAPVTPEEEAALSPAPGAQADALFDVEKTPLAESVDARARQIREASPNIPEDVARKTAMKEIAEIRKSPLPQEGAPKQGGLGLGPMEEVVAPGIIQPVFLETPKHLPKRFGQRTEDTIDRSVIDGYIQSGGTLTPQDKAVLGAVTSKISSVRPRQRGVPPSTLPGKKAPPAAATPSVVQKYQHQGWIDIRGHLARDTLELARLLTLNYAGLPDEHNRIVFVKDGKVVANPSETSGISPCVHHRIGDPKQQARVIQRIKSQMQRLGADGFYSSHNHTGGDAVMSDEDKRSAAAYKKIFGKAFLGEIVIDRIEYSFDPGGNPQTFPLGEQIGEWSDIGAPMNTSGEAARALAAVHKGDKHITVMLLDTDRRVMTNRFFRRDIFQRGSLGPAILDALKAEHAAGYVIGGNSLTGDEIQSIFGNLPGEPFILQDIISLNTGKGFYESVLELGGEENLAGFTRKIKFGAAKALFAPPKRFEPSQKMMDLGLGGPTPEQADTIKRLVIENRLVAVGKEKFDRIKFLQLMKRLFEKTSIEDLSNSEAQILIEHLERGSYVRRLQESRISKERQAQNLPGGGKELYNKIRAPIKAATEKELAKLGQDLAEWEKSRGQSTERQAFQRPGVEIGNSFIRLMYDMRNYFDWLAKKTGEPWDEAGQGAIDGALQSQFYKTKFAEEFRQMIPKPYEGPGGYTANEKEQAMALVDRDPVYVPTIDAKGNPTGRRLVPKPVRPSPDVLALAKAFERTFQKVAPLVQTNQFLDYFYGRSPRTAFQADAVKKMGRDWLTGLCETYITLGLERAEEKLHATNVGLVGSGYFTHELNRYRQMKSTPPPKVGGRVLSREEEVNLNERDPADILFHHVNRVVGRYYLNEPINGLEHLFNETKGMFGENTGKLQNLLETFVVRAAGRGIPYAGNWILKTFMGTMLNARLMLPEKLLMNLLQNVAMDPAHSHYLKNAVDVFSKLPEEDKNYYLAFVAEKEAIRRDYLLRDASKVGKIATSANLFPATDAINRVTNFTAHLSAIKPVMSDYMAGKIGAKKMFNRSLMWFLYPREQARAMEILAADGGDAAARYISGEVSRRVNFTYSRFMRGPSEQSAAGEIMFQLATYGKGAARRIAQPFISMKTSPTMGGKARGFLDLPKLLVMSALADLIFRKITGREGGPGPYSIGDLIKQIPNRAAGARLPIEEMQKAQKFVEHLADGETEQALAIVDQAGRTFLPFYETLCREAENMTGRRYIGVLEAIANKGKLRKGQSRKTKLVERDGLGQLQHLITGGNPPVPGKPSPGGGAFPRPFGTRSGSPPVPFGARR